MSAMMSAEEVRERHQVILAAARWCFLHFGFAKTSLEDIAKRAGLSRTLLYRTFRDKEAIYQAVFADWLVSRQPAARQAATAQGTPYDRLLAVCRLMVLEPWAEMVGATMGSEFLEVCGRIDPENEALYRAALLACVATILDDDLSARVFLLALDGLFADHPPPATLEERTRLLAARFAPRSKRKATSA